MLSRVPSAGLGAGNDGDGFQKKKRFSASFRCGRRFFHLRARRLEKDALADQKSGLLESGLVAAELMESPLEA